MKGLGGGGIEKVQLHSFLNSAVDGGEWAASDPGRAFPSGERTPDTGGWVGHRPGLDAEDRGNIL
jgi:hypothetical protein